jgi:hypothetical protein
MENELYHVGTKMHSGRYPYGSGDRPYQREGGIRKYHKKALKNEKTDYKYVKTLSDDELWKRINRLNLEKKYTDAVNQDMYAAKTAVKQAVGDVGIRLIKGAGYGAASYLVAELAKNKGNLAATDLNQLKKSIMLAAGLGAAIGVGGGNNGKKQNNNNNSRNRHRNGGGKK